jgi:DNA-binding MarR family transcriptional regulator
MIVATATVMLFCEEDFVMVMDEISVMARGYYVFFERELAVYGIRMSQLHILIYLSNVTKTKQEAVADYFHIDKGAVTKAIVKLEEKKLICRVVNTSNRREKQISITDEGRQLLKDVSPIVKKWHNEFFNGFTAEEILEFTRLIEKAAENSRLMTAEKNQ